MLANFCACLSLNFHLASEFFKLQPCMIKMSQALLALFYTNFCLF